MTDATVTEIAHRALLLTITVGAPALGVGLLVGLIVSVLQAATQIHEMSLTFIPKIVAVAITLAVCGQWMMSRVVSFTVELFNSIPNMVR